ncbi:hypothetical protein GE09DRAFT_1227035 [Coniochaeta sp. 2T2.1]|nr:hypothetical protein GE09DRAFT_1227035 [Coniochaeta sp. 2T2.1]
MARLSVITKIIFLFSLMAVLTSAIPAPSVNTPAVDAQAAETPGPAISAPAANAPASAGDEAADGATTTNRPATDTDAAAPTQPKQDQLDWGVYCTQGDGFYHDCVFLRDTFCDLDGMLSSNSWQCGKYCKCVQIW